MKKTVRDIDVSNKRVLVRCDFNVPLKEGEITDDSRIRGACETIEYLIQNHAKVVLLSHMGRPKGRPDEAFSLKVVGERLTELLDKRVHFVKSDRVVDDEVRSAVSEMEPGQVVLLENTRFRPEETKNSEAFSEELASLGEIFVNDAFGTAHRAHCSTAGIAEYLPAVSGFLMEREIKFLGEAMEAPRKPFIAIIGGAKVSDKILIIEQLLRKVDCLIIGGGMAYTFLKAKGFETGLSIVDEEAVEMAGALMNMAEEQKVEMLLPVDTAGGREFSNEAEKSTVSAMEIPKDFMGLDIGPETAKLFGDRILAGGTVFWNGPMGVFEMSNYEFGTRSVAEAMAETEAMTIVGGGDSAAAIRQFGLEDSMVHISTGGGASLEFLEGKPLPGVVLLEDV